MKCPCQKVRWAEETRATLADKTARQSLLVTSACRSMTSAVGGSDRRADPRFGCFALPETMMFPPISRNIRVRLCFKTRIWIRAALFTAGFVRLHRLISTGWAFFGVRARGE